MKKKNKPLTIILLVVVGVVWVNVIIKIVNNLTADNVDNMAYSSTSSGFNIPNSEERSFTLKVNYKDPFLRPVAIANHKVDTDGEVKTTYTYVESGSTSEYSTTPSRLRNGKASIGRKTNVVTTPTPFVWPKITYHGIVRRSGNDKGLVVLKFRDQLYKLRKGDQFQTDYSVEEVYRDSILIRHKQVLKMFYR